LSTTQNIRAHYARSELPLISGISPYGKNIPGDTDDKLAMGKYLSGAEGAICKTSCRWAERRQLFMAGYISQLDRYW